MYFFKSLWHCTTETHTFDMQLILGERFGVFNVLLNLLVHAAGCSCSVRLEALFFKQWTQNHVAHVSNLSYQTGCWCKHRWHTWAQHKHAAVTEHGANVTTGTCTSLPQVSFHQHMVKQRPNPKSFPFGMLLPHTASRKESTGRLAVEAESSCHWAGSANELTAGAGLINLNCIQYLNCVFGGKWNGGIRAEIARKQQLARGRFP